MPALGFSANSVPRLAPSTARAKPWRSGTEQKPRFFPNDRRLASSASFECRAAFSSSSSSVGDYDLYDLLGLESSSDQSQIKSAYRALQKQCHPDVAGPAGHDMAIILNEAYAVLSDPHSRFAYDKVNCGTKRPGGSFYCAWSCLRLKWGLLDCCRSERGRLTSMVSPGNLSTRHGSGRRARRELSSWTR